MTCTIPSNFDNFKQRELQLGMETCSTTSYKGFEIFLRAYAMSGIYYRINKLEGEKRVKVRQRNYNFKLPFALLQEAKDYIDKNLIEKAKL